MSELPGVGSFLSILGLRSIRAYIRRSHAIMMTAFFAIVYALGSMVVGSMLLLTPLSPPYYAEILWTGGAPAWNYPGVLIVQPWGVITLPFFATFAMIVVSTGVGIGMSVAVLLGIALVRNRRARAGQPATVGSVAGLTPAMIALVTLGACCSTTAAATAGVGLVGQVTGTTTNNLLVNNWFLGVFQMVVVWVALLAQELLLRIYGGLFGIASISGGPSTEGHEPRRADRKVVASAALRVGLLIGGVTWSLAMVASWTTVSPTTASPTLWFSWLVQHQLISIFAVVAALFPRGLGSAVEPRLGTLGVGILRGALLLGGLSLVVGVPPPFADGGAAGFANQLVAVLGGPSAWGASWPVFGPGPALYFNWGVQYLLLGGFAITAGLWPGRVLAFLRRSAVGASLEDGDIAFETGPPSPGIGPTELRIERAAMSGSADAANPGGGRAHT